MDIIAAAKQLKKGEDLARKSWIRCGKPPIYLNPRRQLMNRRWEDSADLTIDDLLAKDWEVVPDQEGK